MTHGESFAPRTAMLLRCMRQSQNDLAGAVLPDDAAAVLTQIDAQNCNSHGKPP